MFVNITPVFTKCSKNLFHSQVTDEDIHLHERPTCLLYNRTAIFQSVKEFFHYLFPKKGREIDTILPTKDALLQHITHATYQVR